MKREKWKLQFLTSAGLWVSRKEWKDVSDGLGCVYLFDSRLEAEEESEHMRPWQHIGPMRAVRRTTAEEIAQ